MQQPRLSRKTSPHHFLQIPIFIPIHTLHREAITRSGHQRRRINDQCTQLLKAAPKGREIRLARPDIRGSVLGELCVDGGGALQGRVFVEGAVEVVGALVGVVVAVAEGFFAQGPADEVFCGRAS